MSHNIRFPQRTISNPRNALLEGRFHQKFGSAMHALDTMTVEIEPSKELFESVNGDLSKLKERSTARAWHSVAEQWSPMSG